MTMVFAAATLWSDFPSNSVRNDAAFALYESEGFTVTRRLREWTDIPLIVLSAVGDEDAKSRTVANLLGDAGGLAQTRNLIWCLDQVGRSYHNRRLGGWAAGEKPMCGLAHRPGHLIDRDVRPSRYQITDYPRELLDTFL